MDISLRNYFAGLAMQALIENQNSLDNYFNENNITTREEMTSKIAEIAFDYADAMIEKMEKDKK